jgi:hypothetical protein
MIPNDVFGFKHILISLEYYVLEGLSHKFLIVFTFYHSVAALRIAVTIETGTTDCNVNMVSINRQFVYFEWLKNILLFLKLARCKSKLF